MSVEKIELDVLSPEDVDARCDSHPDVSETKARNSQMEWCRRELHSSVSLPSGKHHLPFTLYLMLELFGYVGGFGQ